MNKIKAQISIEFTIYLLLILIILFAFVNINNHLITKIKSQDADTIYLSKLDILIKNKLKLQNIEIIPKLKDKNDEIKK
jgi:uncharacterized protein (UPF0333 family)